VCSKPELKVLQDLTAVKKRTQEFVKCCDSQSASPRIKRQLRRISECGSVVLLRDYFENPDVGVRLHKANYCHLRKGCELCALVASARTVARLITPVQSILEARANLVPLLVTSTVSNGPDLAERVRHVLQSWKAVRGSGRLYDLAGLFSSAWAGGYWQLEVKRGGGSGLWHPHIHALVFHDGPLPADATARYARQWAGVTGDSSVVDVQEVDLSQGLVKPLLEIGRYTTKFSKVSAADRLEILEELQDVRSCGAWGCLYGKVQLGNAESDLEGGLEMYVFRQLVFRWSKGSYNRDLALEAGLNSGLDFESALRDKHLEQRALQYVRNMDRADKREREQPALLAACAVALAKRDRRDVLAEIEWKLSEKESPAKLALDAIRAEREKG